MNLLNVQVQEMKSMSNAIRKLEGIEASLSLSLSLSPSPSPSPSPF